VQESFLNLKGIYLLAAQKDKCQEKVWKKDVEFEEGKKNRSSKRSFSSPQLPTHMRNRAKNKYKFQLL
jgi:hypothetical protein